jgi:hypothetical protein
MKKDEDMKKDENIEYLDSNSSTNAKFCIVEGRLALDDGLYYIFKDGSFKEK